MDFGFNALQNLETQLKQIQGLMKQPETTVTAMPFVDGIDGAKTYLKSMAANSSAAVFDKEESVFYTLSVDANGNPAPIKVGRFTLEDAPKAQNDTITKADLDAFKSEIIALIKEDKE